MDTRSNFGPARILCAELAVEEKISRLESEVVKEHNILIGQQRLAVTAGRFGGEFEVAKWHHLKR
jgi:hypothetical protein